MSVRTKTVTARGPRRLAIAFSAGAVVLSGVAGTAPAQAAPVTTTLPGSLVYIKGYDVYVARPDGTGERRLTTTGTAADPWVSPTGDDLGNVVAARGTVVHRMDRSGTELDSFDPLDVFDMWGHQYGGKVVSASVAPDGSKIAYTYSSFHCVFTDCRDYWATGVSAADGSSPQTQYGTFEADSPAWVSDSRLIGNGTPFEGVRLFDADGGGQDWFHDGVSPLFVPLTEPVVSRDGTMLATTRGAGSASHVTTYTIDGDILTGSRPATPTTVCENYPVAGQGSAAFAPDGSALAWSQPDGVWTKPDPLDCDAPAKLVVPGAHDVSWAKAALPAPVPSDDDPHPHPQATALKLKHAPKLTGIARVGKVLRLKGGVWSPAPRTKAFQWLRNGKPIAKAKRATYRLTKKDRGRRISVRVLVKKPGLKSATWTSKRVTVRR